MQVSAAMEHEAWCKVLHTMKVYDQVDVTRARRKGHPTDRGEAQVQAHVIRRCWRRSTIHGSLERKSSGVGDIAETHRVDRLGDAKGSHGGQGETQGARGEKPGKKERRQGARKVIRTSVLGHSFESIQFFLFLIVCMSIGVGVGAADASSRQRNIFPLPEILGGDGAGPSTSDWCNFANEGIKALNELAGCLNSQSHVRKKPTRAQRRVLSQISDAYREASAGLQATECHEGVRGLCSSSRLYDNSRSDVQPYAKEHLLARGAVQSSRCSGLSSSG